MIKAMLNLTVILYMFIGFGFANEQETAQAKDRQYVKVEVDGLACPFCAYGLEKKLKNIEAMQDLSIEIEGGYATFNVPADHQITKEKLNKIVEDAGFTAREVTFSNEPFQKPEQDEK